MKLVGLCLLASAALMLPLGASAERWSKVVSCENGAAHLDVDLDDRRNLQLVVRGEDLLKRLHEAGLVSLSYGQNELVLRGQHADLQQVSATETEPRPLGAVFSGQDFKKMLTSVPRFPTSGGQAKVHQVEARGDRLVLSLLNYEAGQECTNYDRHWLECRGEWVIHRTFNFAGEMDIGVCRSL